MHEEFEQVYREYYGSINKFILKLCGDSTLAEELTQETFYRTYLSLHRFQGKSSLYTFIVSIAKHTYYKHMKKNKPVMPYEDIDEQAYLPQSHTSGDPLYIYEKKDERYALRRIIDQLPEKYRDVILYRIYAEMTFEQVAKVMDITENSAKVLFHRAKKKLSEELKNEDYL